MKVTDDELKGIYQARTARGASPGCPSAEVFLRAAAHQIDADESGQLIDHLVHCSDCTEEYRLVVSSAHTTESEKPTHQRGEKGSASAPRWVGFRKWRLAAAVALVAIAAAASVVIWQASRRVDDSSDRVRGMASVAVELVPRDRATLSEPPRELSWSAIDFAETYRVVIYDHKSTPVWESAPADVASVALPDSVRQEIRARGGVTYWRIIIQHGVESRSSELFQFTVRPQ